MRELLGALIGYWIYPISLITRRNRYKWCFGGDANSKYLFLLGDYKNKGIRPIWYSNDKVLVAKYKSLGYEAYLKTSIIGLYHLLTAKVYIVTHGVGDVNRWTCGNVKIVNLWHGLPYKKIGLEDGKHHKTWFYYLLHPTSLKPFDLQLVTSFYTRDIFIRSLKVRDNHVVEAMLPRNMVFLFSKEEIISFLKRLKEDDLLNLIDNLSSYSRSYIYMPTFRDSERDFVDEAQFDFEQLDKLMEEENALFIIKLHPATFSVKLSRINQYKHIKLLERHIDVYPILPFTTTLITDYSSIYFDYILMANKRVIFYTFDIDNYKMKDRDFNFSSSYMKGEYCYSFSELMEHLSITYNHETISQDEIKSLFWNKNCSITPIIEGILNLVDL